MTWPRLRTKCYEEICLGSLYSSRKGRGEGGGGYTFLVALFMTGVTHLLVGSSLYKGPHVLTTAGQELLRVFRVELF